MAPENRIKIINRLKDKIENRDICLYLFISILYIIYKLFLDIRLIYSRKNINYILKN